MQSGLDRHVGKCPVPVVMVEAIVPVIGDEEIFVPIIVIVSDADSVGPAAAHQSGLRRDIGERAVAIVLVKAVGRIRWLAIQPLAAQAERRPSSRHCRSPEKRSRRPCLRSRRSHDRGPHRPWPHAGRRSAQRRRNGNRAQPIWPRREPPANSEPMSSQARPESFSTRGVASNRRNLQSSSWVRICASTHSASGRWPNGRATSDYVNGNLVRPLSAE